MEIKRRGKTQILYECHVPNCNYSCKKIDAYQNHYRKLHPGIETGKSEPEIINPVDEEIPNIKLEPIAEDMFDYLPDEIPGMDRERNDWDESDLENENENENNPITLRDIIMPDSENIPNKICELTYGLESAFPQSLAGYKNRLEDHKELHLKLLQRNNIGTLDSLPFSNFNLADRTALLLFHAREITVTFLQNLIKRKNKPLTDNEIKGITKKLISEIKPIDPIEPVIEEKLDFLTSNDT